MRLSLSTCSRAPVVPFIAATKEGPTSTLRLKRFYDNIRIRQKSYELPHLAVLQFYGEPLAAPFLVLHWRLQ